MWANIYIWGKNGLIYCTTFTDIAVVIQGQPCNFRDPELVYIFVLWCCQCQHVKRPAVLLPQGSNSPWNNIGLPSVFSSELVEDNRRVLADQYMNREQESRNSQTRNCTIKGLLWNKFTSLRINGFSKKYWTYSFNWKLLWNQMDNHQCCLYC